MKSKKLPPAVFQKSRRLKRPRSDERDGIRSLLNRLQHIVPEAPKDRQLPQVQVIQHVINYICQLQHQVVQHPRFGKMQIPPEIANALSETAAASQTVSGRELPRDTGRQIHRQTDRQLRTRPAPNGLKAR